MGAASLVLAMASALAAPLKLHVPSPDWRDQVIYFALTDRFDDGDPANNDQGYGEFRAGTSGYWQGGDLKGLTRRLDYIRGLGATAVWITPPVANRAYAPALRYAGYHGYWAEHFGEVDAHLGTLRDYQRLSHELHRRSMYLVQDIVVNHTADYFHYAGGWDAADPARFYAPNPDGRGRAAPRQWPFSLNDPRLPAHRDAGIYHWTPDVINYADVNQERNWQMSGLDDLNTENPLVRRALRRSYGHWIRAVGVDAFRVDTAFYVPPDFYVDFLRARESAAPGVLAAARATGRRDFFVFGEGFGIDKPGETTQARKIERYVRDEQGRPVMPGMLNFPLYGSLNQVFARGAPTAELAGRIRAVMQVHADPHRMPTFVDNHDVDRFLAGGREPGLKQALLALMTLPGIPVLYYGTEQGFTQQRAAMFAAGVGSGGRDHFDPQHPLYRFIAEITRLRREHRVLSRGTPRILAEDASGPGALAWTMSAAPREPLLVAMNTATHPVLADNLELPAGTRLQPLFAIDGVAPDLVVDGSGRLSINLPPSGAYVWKLLPPAAATTAAGAADRGVTRATIDPLPEGPLRGDLELAGSAPPGSRVELVVDGRLHEAQVLRADAAGRWRSRLATADMIDPTVAHRVVALVDGRASDARRFQVQRDWTLVADVDDPAGDDRGPRGSYRYPTDPGWGDNRQLDLRRLRLFTSGGALRIELTTHRVTQGWNPANGFDRVAFTIAIELPGQPPGSGASSLPLQQAELPGGMAWHRRIRAHGWSNALFSSEQAGAQADGLPMQHAARLEVQRDANRVTFTVPAAALGSLPSLAGVRVYVATWDYDAGFRALAPEAQGYVFGGGAADDPKVMDDIGPVVVP